ncbi:hypothetical protein [Rubidibacter lacunae]|uniref:hypothetical protein n=1 Tax=Rubidibacter lacunae TaxID=582514 RepID=UPI0012ECAF8A|nr:hypothetical protein [Rubidibacter lacunae]
MMKQIDQRLKISGAKDGRQTIQPKGWQIDAPPSSNSSEFSRYKVKLIPFGKPTKMLFPINDIAQFGKKFGKTIMSNVSKNAERQRVSRLVRKSLSFFRNSKNILLPIGTSYVVKM